jgi:hypothetical protein
VQQTLPTAAALSIAGIPRKVWASAQERGFFRAGPRQHSNGRAPLRWSTDQLVCLSWYYALYTCGMKRPLAGELSALLQTAMTVFPEAENFTAYAWDDGQVRIIIGVQPPPEANGKETVLMEIPVTVWRSRVKAAVAVYDSRKKARPGDDA